MGLVSAAAVLAFARPDLVTLEERTAVALLCEEEELLLIAVPELLEVRVAVEELPELLARVAVELLAELLELRVALELLLELERVAVELLPELLELRVALEVLVPELLRVSCDEEALLLVGLLLELLTLLEERVAVELLLELRVAVELLVERVAEPLLVLVCAAI